MPELDETPSGADDLGLRAFSELQETILQANLGYARIAGQMPAHASAIEDASSRVAKAADRVEDTAKAVTGHINADRARLVWTSATAALPVVFLAAGLGYLAGSHTGYEQGRAITRQDDRSRDTLAQWAISSPSARLAYAMDRSGELQAFALCRIDGYAPVHDKRGLWCQSKSHTGIEWSLPPAEGP